MCNCKKTSILIILLSLLFTLTAQANEATDLPEQFLTAIVAGHGSKAVDNYFFTNPIMLQKTQQIEMVKTQIDTVFKFFGPAIGYEKVTTDDLSPSLKRFVYISKHEFHVITWEFYIYKPNDAWIANNMTFDDQFSALGSKK